MDDDLELDIDLSTVGVDLEPAEDASQPETTSQEPANADAGEGNPAWQPYLERVPESVRPILRPVFEDWDKGVQTQFRKIHSEYEAFKPYKPFIDQGIEVPHLQNALSVANAMDTDPAAFYERLGGWLRENGLLKEAAQAEAIADDLDNDDNDTDPRYAELEQKYNKLEQTLNARAQFDEDMRNRQEAEAQVDRDIQALQEKVGTLSKTVLGNILQRAAMSHGQGKPITLEQAYELERRYMSEILKASKKNPAPKIPTPGGSGSVTPTVPAGGFKSSKERREAAAAFFAAQQEG